MRHSGHFARPLVLAFVLGLSISSVRSQAPAPGDLLADLPAGIKAQRVFEGASLSRQAMSTYRLVTSMSPENLLEQVERSWSQRAGGRVWRDAHGVWLTVSRVVRPPVAEVLQVRRNRAGMTEAWLSVSHGADPGGQVAVELLRQLLPAGSTVVQQFSTRDDGRISSMLIAKAHGSVQGLARLLDVRSKQASFERAPRFQFTGDVNQSFVGFFSRGKEELIVTLDRESQGVAMVLQYTAPGRSVDRDLASEN